MRTLLGLALIAMASASALAGAQSLRNLADQSSAYVAGQLVGAVALALIFGVTGFKWVSRPGTHGAG